MSAGDVVCTGWLIKSPPEKKLKRYAWRRRWFVLRRGRMSGNPDVLEYYRSKSSKKPIRIIDLRECEVQTHTELQLIRRDFQNQHLFLVKTSSRIFYLVAKTEDEMKSWVHNIGQICHFELMNDSPVSLDSLDSTQQTSPARSSDTPLSTNADLTSNVDATNGSCSDSEFSSPLDYLFLSQCETGRISMTRCNSCSNSDRSIECSSSDNTFEDMFASPLCIHPFSPCQRTSTPLSASSSILSRNPHHLSEVFKFDTVSSAQTLNGLTDSFSPPPRPPKPSHFAECNLDSTCHMPVTRRISFVGLDHARTGVFDGNLVKSLNKRLSINLPHQVTVHSPSWTDCNEDSYIPMDSRVSSPVSTFNSDSDGCIPRSPTFVNCLMSCDEAENPPPIVPLRGLPYNLDPPPVNRDLKPRRKLRPPPLDLRGLSTISENTSHLLLTRTRTEPSNFLHCLPLKKEPVMSGPLANGDNSYFLAGLNHPWPGRIRLDYLSLDFNSASPSPVQMKPLFTDEDRVDYVQVDEKKTQALQNTKIEWKDVRQSKV